MRKPDFVPVLQMAWVVDDLDVALADLHSLTLSLPQHLHQRLHELAGEVRGEYRTWIALTWVSSLSAAVIVIVLANYLVSEPPRPRVVMLPSSS